VSSSGHALLCLMFGGEDSPQPQERRSKNVPYIPLVPRELGLAFFDKSLDGLFMVCRGEAVFL